MDSHISFDEVNETSHFDGPEDYPFGYKFDFVVNLLEEKDSAWAPDTEGIVKEEFHLPQVELSHPLKPIFTEVFGVDGKDLPLPVYSVNLVLERTVEALVGKVTLVVHLHGDRLVGAIQSNDLPLLDVPHKVIMDHVVIMVERHENLVVVHKAARDVGVGEVVNSHGKVVQAKQLVEVYLIFQNLRMETFLLRK